jgi:hypothetical protein
MSKWRQWQQRQQAMKTWQTSRNPATLLGMVQGLDLSSQRKLQLFTGACYRHVLLDSDLELLSWLDLSDRVADGLIDHTELRNAWNWRQPCNPLPFPTNAEVARNVTARKARNGEAERRWQVWLLHEMFENRFPPIFIETCWQTTTVIALAQSIYAERAFDRMPILGDALEEAGCTTAAILDHCRRPGEHVRGCWLVDLILGKE